MVLDWRRFLTLVKGLKVSYADPTFLPDEDSIKIWYSLLKDIPYEVLSDAIQKHICTSSYKPTVADIRKLAGEIVSGSVEKQMGELEAWNLVYKAVCNSTYNAESEFAKLPKEIQVAVGDPGVLREWGGMSIDSVNSVAQSHFLRNYRTVAARMKEERLLPPSLQKSMGIETSANNTMMIGGE